VHSSQCRATGARRAPTKGAGSAGRRVPTQPRGKDDEEERRAPTRLCGEDDEGDAARPHGGVREHRSQYFCAGRRDTGAKGKGCPQSRRGAFAPNPISPYPGLPPLWRELTGGLRLPPPVRWSKSRGLWTPPCEICRKVTSWLYISLSLAHHQRSVGERRCSSSHPPKSAWA